MTQLLTTNRLSLGHKLLTLILLSGGALAQSSVTPAPAQPSGLEAFAAKFPPNYFSRFGSTTVLVTQSDGFGVRAFPLPLTQDIRFTLAKRPNYWEYNVFTRYQGVLIAAGVFDNGATAKTGIPRAEMTYDPYTGVQWSAKWQGAGYHSKVSVGYAFTVANNKVRVLNNVGIAEQKGVVAPYTQSEVTARDTLKLNPATSVRGVATARLYTFPAQSTAQTSVDLTFGATYNPSRALLLDVSHLERFAFGKVAIPDFNFARYEETNGSLLLRTPINPNQSTGLGGFRIRATRNWTGDYTYLRGDILIYDKRLPVLIGPTIGYQWGPTTQTSTFLFGVSSAPK